MTQHTHTTTPLAVRELGASIGAMGDRARRTFQATALPVDKAFRAERKAELLKLASEAKELARML